MNETNLQKFTQLLQTDPALQAKARAIYADAALALARLSEEAGLPCQPEDFSSGGELNDSTLDNIAAGFHYPIQDVFRPVI